MYFYICDPKAALRPAERELRFKEAAFRAEERNDRTEKATFSEEGKCSRKQNTKVEAVTSGLLFWQEILRIGENE